MSTGVINQTLALGAPSGERNQVCRISISKVAIKVVTCQCPPHIAPKRDLPGMPYMMLLFGQAHSLTHTQVQLLLIAKPRAQTLQLCSNSLFNVPLNSAALTLGKKVTPLKEGNLSANNSHTPLLSIGLLNLKMYTFICSFNGLKLVLRRWHSTLL